MIIKPQFKAPLPETSPPTLVDLLTLHTPV
jgi:hypothetical protein